MGRIHTRRPAATLWRAGAGLALAAAVAGPATLVPGTPAAASEMRFSWTPPAAARPAAGRSDAAHPAAASPFGLPSATVPPFAVLPVAVPPFGVLPSFAAPPAAVRPAAVRPAGRPTAAACTSADLMLRAGPTGAGGGRRYAVYDLVDGSARACTVRGFPGTRLLRPDRQADTRLREERSTAPGVDSPPVPLRTIRLTPGGQSDFWMEWTPRPGRLRGSLAVTAPERRTAIVVRNRLVPLDARQLTVSPLTSSVIEH